MKRAELSDLGLVQEISAEAYIPAYEAVIGEVPRPAYEDYRPRVSRGEVWLLDTAEGCRGIIVLEAKERYLLVYSLAVRPRFQGRGYGILLLDFAERHAKDIGVRELRLYTNTRMTANVRLYRRRGFHEVGTRAHPSRPGEFLVDMSKTLEMPTGSSE